MSCDCHLEPEISAQRSVLVFLLSINGLVFVAELVIGLIAESIDILGVRLVYGISLLAVGAAVSEKIRAA